MKEQRAKIKNLLVISALGLAMLSLAKPAQAFWPFDFFKEGSKEEAQASPDSGQAHLGLKGGFPALIQKLIDKFNLNPDEVKEVVEEHREEQQKQGQERFEEGLGKAVEEGKITEEQKQAILDKKAEMQANRGELKDLSPEERQEKMKAHQEEMKAWAEEDGIDLEQLYPLGLGGPGGRKRPFGSKAE